MLLLISLLALSVFSLVSAIFSIFRTLRKTSQNIEEQDNDQSALKNALLEIVEKAQKQTQENDPTLRLTESLVGILPSDLKVGSDSETAGPDKKKKRGKKKRSDSIRERNEKPVVGDDSVSGTGTGSRAKSELVCFYPFTSTASATQRKIKQQYDRLVKCNEAKGLTLAQVGDFANCLIEARTELQHKSEAIKRKFTITKALLCKADRSSFERIHQQICKLEMEQKRLEEDAFVYNWLQQQLKLSPAYKKMLEVCTSMEEKENSRREQLENQDAEESPDMSFEELLAIEKKDSFWQKYGKPRTCSSR